MGWSGNWGVGEIAADVPEDCPQESAPAAQSNDQVLIYQKLNAAAPSGGGW